MSERIEMANATPNFSVIIPTYHRHQELCQCLNGMAPYFDPQARSTHGMTLEVIVSDDAGDPQLGAYLQHRYPWVRYTTGPALGPAANRNHGARQASGDWLVFTDDDCLPQPGWIEAFAQYTDDCDVLEGRTSPVGVRTRADEECPINESGGYLWSCNFAIRRKTFFILGGFNEDFPSAAMEDVELNLRVNKAGLRRKFVPDAAVFHPWRQQKGWEFVRSHTASVGKFVSLHPEQASRFSFGMQLMKAARSFKQNICQAVLSGRYQGVARQILLNFFSYAMAWKAVQKYR